MADDNNGISVRRVTTIASIISLCIGALIQFTVLIIWGARIDYRIDALEKHHLEIHAALQTLDERGSRTIPLLEQRIRQFEVINASALARLEAISSTRSALTIELDFVRQEMVRTAEQQKRIVEALDNVYNKTQENVAKIIELDNRAKVIQNYLKQASPP